MKIAYLINQYPKVSHSFIRREILALEKLGITISRYSIRHVPLNALVDNQDLAEYYKTSVILSHSIASLFFASIRMLAFSPAKFFEASKTAFFLGIKSKRGSLRHIAYLAEACLLKEKLAVAGVGHIHAHFGTNSVMVALLCKLLGGPSYSFTVHGPEEFDDAIGLAIEEKIIHCRFVVAISNFGRSQLMRWCHQEFWERIKVVRCSVDDTFLQENLEPIPPTPRIICVGRLCSQKGQLLLLEALRELDKKGENFEAILAGDGEMRDIVERRIMEYGLKRKVRITGWISGDQVKEEILASRAMVLPSFAEGLPVVIMEALALQRPVVSTYVAGIPELVEHKKNGWLVPAGSVEDLVITLQEVLATPDEQLMLMGKAGAQAIHRWHNSTVEAKKLIDFFEKERVV